MPKSYPANKRGIRKLTKSIQRELDKNPVWVPVMADTSGVELPPAVTVNNYNGPVVTVNGDHAQIAWNNQDVAQEQANTEQVAAGYEELADLVTRLLASLPALGLAPDEETEAQATGETILREVVKAEPDKSFLKRSITMLKGVLAPVATGVGNAATQESADAARHLIEALGDTLPS